MKASKILFVLIAVLLLHSCNEEQATRFAVDKHDIQNDPDWVEITDIDTVDVCIATSLFDSKGLLIKSENEYLNYFNKSLLDEDYVYFTTKYPQYTNCTTTYQSSNIDFSKRDLILFSIMTGGQPKSVRKIYRNSLTKEIIYLVDIKAGYTKEGSGFGEHITIPKIPTGYKFIVDTILVREF